MVLPLRVEGLIVRSPRGRAILTVDHLAVQPGVCLGIRGPSGAGKSTLLFTLAGLIPRAEGAVHWGETELIGLGESKRTAFRRNHVGLIFQDFLLFEELGPRANAAIAAAFSPSHERAPIGRRAGEVLARLALDVEERRTVRSFSGGERQRVAVARALVHDPDIILADEPTASLDRASADRLVDDLAVLVRETGKTLIAVSHDAHLHARMDRIVDVVDGRLQGEEEWGA
ncbi:ABC transporter ATP-binding protein [Consotaella aegiceratis]|uniref:ABC transporter ATP-binding protein n=1 Tax=Consotaella aegiceratis TaxID=3097961 RepID=UPI002F4016A0